jgi:heme oxygenase
MSDNTPKKKKPEHNETPEELPVAEQATSDSIEPADEANVSESTTESAAKIDTARGNRIFRIMTVLVTIIILLFAGFGAVVVIRTQRINGIKDGVKTTLAAHVNVEGSSSQLGKAVQDINVSVITSADDLNTKFSNLDILLKNVQIDQDLLKSATEKLKYDEVNDFRNSVLAVQAKTEEYIANGKKTIDLYKKVATVTTQIDSVNTVFSNYSKKTGTDLDSFYKELEIIANNARSEKEALAAYQVEPYAENFKTTLISALATCQEFATDFSSALSTNDSVKILSTTFKFQRGMDAYTKDLAKADQELAAHEAQVISDLYSAELKVKAEYDRIEPRFKN